MLLVFRLVGAVFRLLTGLALLTLIGSVLIQVISRSFLPFSPVWTEELSRFALLFMIAFGCGLGWRSGELVNVDILTSALPPRGRRLIEAAMLVVTIAFLLVLLPAALRFMQIGAFQTSPALGVRMQWIYVIDVIAPVSLIVFALERLLSPGGAEPDEDPEEAPGR